MKYSKTVSKKLDDNLTTVRLLFHADVNKDIAIRKFQSMVGKNYFLVFIDGMADGKMINDFIIRPFMLCENKKANAFDIIQTSTFNMTCRMDDVVTAVLSGDTAIFVDGDDCCYTCETKGFEHRSVSTPKMENTIKGAQEAFSESVRTNTTLVHRILKSRQLVTEMIPVGNINQSICAIMYLDDIVNKKILAEVKKRLSGIKGDLIMGSGMVEQMIEDVSFSLFPSLLSTERPDRTAHYLASGRVAILVDGTPYAIIAPVTFALLLDAPEGMTQRWQNGTFSRIIRLVALFCTTMLSGTYLALILFHREMIPTPLLNAIMDARENIPFPSVFEVLIMELFFELVRESSLRVPQTLGNAIGIVGALILGQAAVDASLVSPATLIVVALSGIGNVVLPDYDLAFGLRTIKLFIIIMGATAGFLGIAIALVLIFTVLSNQNSFSVPMLSMQSLKWSAGTPLPFQLPLWKQEKRPQETQPQKIVQEPKISRPWTLEQGEDK